MRRLLAFSALFGFAFLRSAAAPGDDGPPIAITSPDTGSTYLSAQIKNRSLIWSKKEKTLIVDVTFIDSLQASGSSTEDSHEFRLPGVTLDEAKGIFSATSAKGDVIPVAHYKKVLFMKTIETLPNAAVRVIHDHGNITVILEAIRPDDPAMRAPPPDPDAKHQVDLPHIDLP